MRCPATFPHRHGTAGVRGGARRAAPGDESKKRFEQNPSSTAMPEHVSLEHRFDLHIVPLY